MRQFKAALILILASGFMTACGPYGKDKDKLGRNRNSSPKTGYEKLEKVDGVEQRRAYTLSGNPELYNELATELKNDSDRMAISIKSIQMDLVQKDSKPSQFNIEFTFIEKKYYGLKSLSFEIPLQAKEDKFHGQAKATQVLPIEYRSHFYATITCTDKLCSRVKLILNEQSQNSRARAGLIYTRRMAVVKKERAQNANRTSSTDIDSLDRNLENVTAEQTSVVVVKGPAYSEVKVTDANNNQVVRVKTELLDTSKMQTTADTVEVSGQKSTLDTNVSGNDPSSGSLIIDLDDQDSGDGIRLTINPEQSLAEEPENQGEEGDEPLDDGAEKHGDFIIQTNPEKGILIPDPELVSDHSQSDVKTVTEQMNEYAEHPEVAWRAKMWGGIEQAKKPCEGGCRTPQPSRLQKFIYNVKFAEDVITEAMLKSDVSAEFAYITLIESSFFVKSDFPIQTNPRSSATGPWQFIDATAEDMVKYANLPYKVHDIPTRGKTDRAAGLDDPRTKLGTATRLAGNLIRKIRDAYPHDVGLAILGFYQGYFEDAKNKRGVGYAIRRACGKIKDKANQAPTDFAGNYCKYQVNLNQIHKYNMMPDEMTDYAFTVLAARLVGRNPIVYGMSMPTADEQIPAELKRKL